jgi:hypothetical protein
MADTRNTESWGVSSMFNAMEMKPVESGHRLAESALAISRRGDTRGALVLLSHGLETAQRDGKPSDEVQSLNAASLVHLMRGDHWTALASAIDAFHIAQRQQHRLDMARATTVLATAIGLLVPIDNVLDLLADALAIAVREHDTALQMRIHNLLGITYGDLGEFNEADVHLTLAQVIALHGEQRADHWRIQANLASLCRKRAVAAQEAGDRAELERECEAGRAILRELLKHVEHEGNLQTHLDALMVLGLIDMTDGKPARALVHFDQAWHLAQAKKHRTVWPGLGVHIGRIEMAAGRLDAAEQTLTLALREAMFYRPSPKTATLCGLLADIRRQRGDARGAERWKQEATQAGVDFDKLRVEARRHLEDTVRPSMI